MSNANTYSEILAEQLADARDSEEIASTMSDFDAMLEAAFDAADEVRKVQEAFAAYVPEVDEMGDLF